MRRANTLFSLLISVLLLAVHAEAAPAGRMRFGTPAAVVIIPATQTIAFGEKTLTGFGADLMQYTGFGTLEITSQVDQGGTPITLFRVNQNALNWRGASTAYASAAPASTNCPCTVVVQEQGNPSVTSTITVNVTPSAMTAREMAGLAVGGRWVTDSVFTIDGTGSTGTHQLRTIFLGTTIARGDTIWMRDGILDPTETGLRIRPKAGSFGASGTITVRSITVDTSETLGIPNRQHGFRFRAMTIDTGTSGDVFLPITFRDIWWEPNTPTSTFGNRYSSSTSGWGVNYYNSRVSGGPGATSASNIGGLDVRGSQTDVVTADSNTLTNVGKAIRILAGSVAGGKTKNAVISNNDGFALYEDFINDGGSEGVYVEDNFARDFLEGGGGDHPDFYQYSCNGASTTQGPYIRRNIFATNTNLATSTAQGIFLRGDGTCNLSGTVIENNIVANLYVAGVYMGDQDNITDRFNTSLSIVSVPSIGLQLAPATVQNFVPGAPEGGTDGVFTYNVSNNSTFTGQGGTVTTTPNVSLANNLSAYLVAMPAYTELGIYTRAQAKAAHTPANLSTGSGGFKNGDNTYNGAIGPDGEWNTGAPY